MVEIPALDGQSIWGEEESPTSPEIRIFQTIVIQAVKDYITNPEEKKIIREWVKKKLGTFKYCAKSMRMSVNHLRKLMLKKFEEIDRTGETVFKYSRAS